jgi:hypothetical protein
MKQPIDKLKVDLALELVCQLGCLTVHEIIIEIERGVLPEPAKTLSEEECKCLLVELKQVMQTYQ